MRMTDKEYAEICADIFHEIVQLRWSEVVHLEKATRRLYKKPDFMDDTSCMSEELLNDVSREAEAYRKKLEASNY